MARTGRAGRLAGVLSFAAALLAPPVLAGFSGTDVFVPTSARAPGANGAQFYSTLWVTNLAPVPAHVQLKFFQRDVSNTSPVTVPVTIAVGETKKYENAVASLFALDGVSGAIRVQSDQEVLASSRTYNLPVGADLRNANGLYFAGIPQSLAIGAGQSSQLQGVSQGGAEDYRYNFGMLETAGAAATVRVTVRGSDGIVVATKDYPLLAFEQKQFGVADAAPGIATANARLDASVVAGAGRVILFGTGIANGSQDSIGYEMSFPSAILGGGVTNLNGLTGAVTLAAGSGVTLTSAGNTITLAAAGGGGLTLPYDGSASTAAGTAAFAVSDTGAGPALSATSAGSNALTATITGANAGDRAVIGIVSAGSPASNTAGVRGLNNGTGANGIGVHGSQAGSGWGVLGTAPSGVGVYGSSTSGVGVYGESATGYAVKGVQGAASGVVLSGGKAGVWGDGNSTVGLFGSSGTGSGVAGASSKSAGVQAFGFTGGTNGAAFYAYANSAGDDPNGSPVAAVFGRGSVAVNGSMSKASGSFKIDHPLAPDTKYLYHSFVESPDMKNIYDGVVVLDARGEAVVTLPDWFAALNRDFRYQLTCIGGYAPVYVAREVHGNAFAIAGGRPGLKVSWQLTGIRQDAWANAHRIVVEEEKPGAERGTYLHPELFGEPEEKSLEWVQRPELMKALRAERERLARAEADARARGENAAEDGRGGVAVQQEGVR